MQYWRCFVWLTLKLRLYSHGVSYKLNKKRGKNKEIEHFILILKNTLFDEYITACFTVSTKIES